MFDLTKGACECGFTIKDAKKAVDQIFAAIVDFVVVIKPAIEMAIQELYSFAQSDEGQMLLDMTSTLTTEDESEVRDD
jgi:hypothetical protein